MQQSLVPVLLLTTVALSTSNVLPLLSTNQLKVEAQGFGQQDNIRTLHHISFLDVLCRDAIQTSRRRPKICELSEKYNTDDNIDATLKDIIEKVDNYDDEGFRKEQWHNYPRQLDRLHDNGVDVNPDKRDSEPDDPGDKIYDFNTPEYNDKDLNEPVVENDPRNIYDTVIAESNPLLILKIKLTTLNNANTKQDEIRNNADDASLHEEYLQDDIERLNEGKNDLNPTIILMKEKREGASNIQNKEFQDKSTNNKKTVNKRIFSLWSRLQSLSHKGHELQHRRHLHAFYGLDGDAGGALTAETRALLRPPGSPLRWG